MAKHQSHSIDVSSHISKDDESKKEDSEKVVHHEDASNDKVFYATIAVILLVIASFVVYVNVKTDDEVPQVEELDYNGWYFQKIANTWIFQWEKGDTLFTIPLRYGPHETENVSIEGVLDPEKFNSKQELYIIFNLTEGEGSDNFTFLTLASVELNENIAKTINRKPVAACAEEGPADCEGLPVMTCDGETPAVYFKEEGDARIQIDGGCITISGEGFELVRAVDRLLYAWYGVIEN